MSPVRETAVATMAEGRKALVVGEGGRSQEAGRTGLEGSDRRRQAGVAGDKQWKQALDSGSRRQAVAAGDRQCIAVTVGNRQ